MVNTIIVAFSLEGVVIVPETVTVEAGVEIARLLLWVFPEPWLTVIDEEFTDPLCQEYEPAQVTSGIYFIRFGSRTAYLPPV